MTRHARTRPLPTPGERAAEASQASGKGLELRRCLETAIENAIALLDHLDAPAEDLEPDTDGEDGGDWEPWLAAPEHCDRQLPWCRGCDDDRETG